MSVSQTALTTSQTALRDAESLTKQITAVSPKDISTCAPTLSFQLTDIETQLETLNFQEVEAAVQPQFKKNIQDAQQQLKVAHAALLNKEVEGFTQGMARLDLGTIKKTAATFSERLKKLNTENAPQAVALTTKSLLSLNTAVSAEVARLAKIREGKGVSVDSLNLQSLNLRSSSSAAIPSLAIPLFNGKAYFATINQHAAAAGIRESACTPTAAAFINEVLNNRTFTMDEVMQAGFKATDSVKARLVGKQQHFTYGEIQDKFPLLQNLAESLSLNLAEWQIVLTDQTQYTQLLNNLCNLRARLALPSIGAILTGQDISYAITVTPNPAKQGTWTYKVFDSHGNGDLMKNRSAFRIEFDTVEATSAFLAQRQPRVNYGPDVQAHIGNTYDLTPIALKRVMIGSKPQPQPSAPQIVDQSTVSILNIAALVTARSSASDPVRALSLIPDSLVDRTSFHTYFIHKNETPGVLRVDGNYGGKAFLCSEDGFRSTEVQRQRAIQRTIVEEALEGLEKAIRSNGETHDFLGILESLDLHESDRAQAQANPVFALFGIIYHLYKEASDRDASMPKPYGDFGRLAFTEETSFPVDKSFRLAAIAKLRSDLHAAWKI